MERKTNRFATKYEPLPLLLNTNRFATKYEKLRYERRTASLRNTNRFATKNEPLRYDSPSSFVIRLS